MASFLEQLRGMTTVVSDTGDFNAIKQFHPQDATTNPSLIAAASEKPEYQPVVDGVLKQLRKDLGATASDNDVAAASFRPLEVAFGLKILDIIPGRVSTEVDARLSYDTDKSVAEAHEIEAPPPAAGESDDADAFNVSRLSPEEQELHRRANRVAKVSMQDIKMLRPEQVRLGREHKDICVRLRDDIEKAHREYDRRFKPIMDHPVDYFYRWMVEILADGDSSAIGEYPYAPASKHR